ncbi:WLM-domain-containing protein [Agrocybe pediades]|nr:WLM-domain-containing protein [Agrocybe pediades]
MVHLRLNEKETNPNPFINFITALRSSADDEENARKLLRALAAQVKPVMKAHGFTVNSFEEYEFNRVFAGRNWNNGETVELVLRRADGSFYPNYWLMSTLCHELAHIKHMNHGPEFQALWSRLRAEVRQLQDRGYYGDGYWSSGQRLRDSARIADDVLGEGDLPEYICGGAQSRSRPSARRRQYMPRGRRREVVPSLHTGAQTAKKRKAGARVTSKYAFAGEGATLAADSDKGTGFGKQASSKRAREERAKAIEQRLAALKGGPTEPTEAKEEEDEDDVEFIPETDEDRRQALLGAAQSNDAPQERGRVGFSWKQFKDDFKFPEEASPESSTSGESADTITHISGEGDSPSCDIPVASGSTSTMGTLRAGDKGKRQASPPVVDGRPTKRLGLDNMVQSEITLRKKEALGMTPIKGGGRTLGSMPADIAPKANLGVYHSLPALEENVPSVWSCLVCTLLNEPDHLSCAACGTPRNEVKWKQTT